METNTSSHHGQYSMGTHSDGGRYSQITAPQMQRYPEGRGSQMYSESAVEPPQHSPTSVETFEYRDMARGSSHGIWYVGSGMHVSSQPAPPDLQDESLGMSTSTTTPYNATAVTDRHTNPTPFMSHIYAGPVFSTPGQRMIVRPQHASNYSKPRGSDMMTSYSHGHPDSGYRSFRGSGYLSQPGDDVPSLTSPTDHPRTYQPNGGMSYSQNVPAYMGPHSDVASTYGPQANDPPGEDHQSAGGHFYCNDPKCDDKSPMGRSAYSKHKSRHDLPWRCEVLGCKRHVKGFATKNDLGRHLKSVHKKLSESSNERSFICRGKDCPHRSKVWPRLDNFKAHCKRLHESENVEKLIQSSEIDARTNRALQESSATPVGLASEASSVQVPATAEDPAIHAHMLLGLSQGGTPRLVHASSPSAPPNEISPEVMQSEAVSASEPEHELVDQAATAPDKNHARIHFQRSTPNDAVERSVPVSEARTRVDAIRGAVENGTISSTAPAPPISCSPALHLSDGPKSSISSYQNRIRLRSALLDTFAAAQRIRSSISSEEIAEMAIDCMTTLCKHLASEIHVSGSESPSNRPRSDADTFLPLSPVFIGSEKRSAADGHLDGESAAKRAKSGVAAAKPVYKCTYCGEHRERKCDLKKHVKRHTRPWGCTNDKCDKAFGSKNDWKRHENSQHERRQVWRCQERSDTSRIGVCAQSFFRAEPFRNHLSKEHKIHDEKYLKTQYRKARVGRDWQDRFWCGFCRRIIKLHHKGLQAFDERFNHIDNDHFHRGERIESWYPLDSDRPKGEILKGKSPSKIGRDAEFDLEVSDDDSDGESDQSSSMSQVQSPSRQPPPPPPSPPPRPPPPVQRRSPSPIEAAVGSPAADSPINSTSAQESAATVEVSSGSASPPSLPPSRQ